MSLIAAVVLYTVYKYSTGTMYLHTSLTYHIISCHILLYCTVLYCLFTRAHMQAKPIVDMAKGAGACCSINVSWVYDDPTAHDNGAQILYYTVPPLSAQYINTSIQQSLNISRDHHIYYVFVCLFVCLFVSTNILPS